MLFSAGRSVVSLPAPFLSQSLYHLPLPPVTVAGSLHVYTVLTYTAELRAGLSNTH